MNAMGMMNHSESDMKMNNSSMMDSSTIDMGNATMSPTMNHDHSDSSVDHSNHTMQNTDHSTGHGTSFYFGDLTHPLLFQDWTSTARSKIMALY